MAKYLIDVNLPYRFSLWHSEDYIHQKDIDDGWTDSQIWHYAETNKLTSITKDSDFSNRILFKNPPPRVIHIKIGNSTIKDLFDTLTPIWDEVLKMSETHRLVNVFRDRIEGIE